MGQHTSKSVISNGSLVETHKSSRSRDLQGFHYISAERFLPLDILHIILEFLDGEGLQLASVLNKDIHALVNTRLWKNVIISDGYEWGSARKRRRFITRECNAVVRCAPRAACIQSIEISIGYSFSMWKFLAKRTVTKIIQALLVVPNLKELRISPGMFPYQTGALSGLLSYHNFPFRLQKLRCDASLDIGIDVFLKRQSSLEEYNLDSDCRWALKDKDLEPVVQRDNRFLPALQRLSGPGDRVRRTVATRSFDTIEINGMDTDSDINLLYSTVYLQPSPTGKPISAAHPKDPVAITRNLSIGLWTAEERDHHIPPLISSIYHLSLVHIRSLRLTAFRLPHLEHLPTALAAFPALEYFEWSCEDYNALGPDIEQEDWIGVLVLACARKCPTLRRVIFQSYYGLTQTFTRVSYSEALQIEANDGMKEKEVQSEAGEPRAAEPSTIPRLQISSPAPTEASNSGTANVSVVVVAFVGSTRPHTSLNPEASVNDASAIIDGDTESLAVTGDHTHTVTTDGMHGSSSLSTPRPKPLLREGLQWAWTSEIVTSYELGSRHWEMEA